MVRYFKVLYDFSASEPVELSVRKGDTVTCTEAIERDGWIKVELATDTRKKGFVPVSYLKEQPQPSMAPSAQGTPMRGAAGSPPGDSSQYGRPSTGLSSHQQEAPISAADYAANPAAVVDAFMKNEVFFKQLMKQRQEALSKMESALTDATADVAACKDKNAVLARKLRDLDQQTEKERRKWRERVEEERLSIQRAAASASSLHGPGIESRTVRVTETYSDRVSVRN